MKTSHANMEDQVHKPHRKSKDRKEKKEHTGGEFSLLLIAICDRRMLTLLQSAIQRPFLLPGPVSFKDKPRDRKM